MSWRFADDDLLQTFHKSPTTTNPKKEHVSRANSYGSDVESQTSTITPSHSPERGREKSQSCQPWKIDARVISDATIGLSDGLTVPFALTAGLSALGNTRVVIYGGLAELIAGAISMGKFESHPLSSLESYVY